MSHLPVVMTIAGSDSGGGAGIQADLKTFQAFGCYGTSALTAITAQNTRGVTAIQAVDPEVVSAQIKAVLEDFPVGAAKTGMLFSSAIIRAVRDAWRAGTADALAAQRALVVDPVMVASSGDRLLQPDAEQELIEFLKTATIITPNLPEAEVILDQKIVDQSGMEAAARRLHQLTGARVYLKGGHRLDEKAATVLDLYFDGERMLPITGPRFDSRHTHGTGCTLSAAMAAGLARGDTPEQAVRAAKEYLEGALRSPPGLGAGIGPLNHLWRQ